MAEHDVAEWREASPPKVAEQQRYVQGVIPQKKQRSADSTDKRRESVMIYFETNLKSANWLKISAGVSLISCLSLCDPAYLMHGGMTLAQSVGGEVSYTSWPL